MFMARRNKNKSKQILAGIIGACVAMLALSILVPQCVIKNSAAPAPAPAAPAADAAPAEKQIVPVQVEQEKGGQDKKSAAEKSSGGRTVQKPSAEKKPAARQPADSPAPQKQKPQPVQPQTPSGGKQAEPSAPEKKPAPAAEAPVSSVPADKPGTKTADKAGGTPAVTPGTTPAASGLMEIPQAVGSPVLVFVFDDGGQNISHLKKFLALPFPITVAVLPGLAHSKESAELVRKAAGKELMLHQPMQALNAKVNPGPGAITPDMRMYDIEQTLRKNIEELGPVAGLNNHEGSRIMENIVQTGTVLDYAAANGIFFLDSRTTAATQAPQAALERDMKIYIRDIFLDNKETKEEVLAELAKGLAIANRKGYCIMIGHVWSAGLIPPILEALYPELVKKGYRFSVVSKSGAGR